MSATARSLALEKQALVARSALCRSRLRWQAAEMHRALGRTARLVAVAAQIFVVAKVAAKLIARFR